MIGNVGLSGNNIYIPYTITYCENTGEITGGSRAGGFVGYCYAGSTQNIIITSSVSIANVYSGRPATNLEGSNQYSYQSLIIGYTNSVNNKIVGCLAVGELRKNTRRGIC